MVRVENFLDSWTTVREDTALAVEDFPGAELDFKPVPELMSFREIAEHILNAGHGLTGMLIDGETDMTAPDFRERMKKHFTNLSAGADTAILATALRQALKTRVTELAGKPSDFYSGIVTRFDGQKVTRMEMLQFIKEHELTHRSQLFMYLRLKGFVPATTRRRLAKQPSK